ncbi:MAG: hypothetical protein HOP29_18730 [Phycisphaerales bacterium]|nr:hypothetical protein [Phycisphaerales bacterium]
MDRLHFAELDEIRRAAEAADVPLWQRVAPDIRGHFMAVERVERLLKRVTYLLDRGDVAYAVIGGNAVAHWVSTIDSGATRATKDVDLLMRREDLAAAARALAGHGFIREEVMDIPVFLEESDPRPSQGVHIIIANEKVRASATLAAPDVGEVERSESGYLVLKLAALVAMKLDANRRHDQVHIEDMLRVGLIDTTIAVTLPEELLQRLRHVRDTMEWFTAPPEF